ncbi:MAG: BBP7 family outer membrane beta-barrel protein [Planctomycetales bacterium]
MMRLFTETTVQGVGPMKLTVIFMVVLLPALSGMALGQSVEVENKGLIDSTSLPNAPHGIGEIGSPPFGLGDDAPEWLRLNKMGPARFVAESPGLTVYAGFLAVQRAALDGNPLVQNAADQFTLFDSGSYELNWATGLDLGIGHRFPSESFVDGWDARFMGAQGATAEESFTTPGPWVIPGDSTIWPQADITGKYDSRVVSAEWNLEHDADNGCFTCLAGIRWLQLDDHLSTKASFSNADALTLATDTTNNLYGGQVGLRIAISKVGTPLEIVTRLKAGLYANSSSVSSIITQYSQPGGWVGGQDATRLAFVGDLEFNVNYHLSDRWSTYLAWQMLWIEGVAVAGNQPQPGRLLAGDPAFDQSNGAWFSGIIAGVQFRW